MSAQKIEKTLRRSAVCPVSASDVVIERGGRLLLSIPSVEFGTDDSSGSCTMVVGPNGAGKSLLARTLCALQVADSGNIQWAGRAPDTVRRHKVGLILQKPVLLKRSAIANLLYTLGQTSVPRGQRQRLAMDALRKAGLATLYRVPAHHLSGGEQQRLALARALLLNPDILFLDEATANVDPSSTLVIEQQLRDCISEGLTVVMVTHDQAQVQRLGQNVLLMHQGRIIEHASLHSFFESPAHELTRRWLAGDILV